MASGFETHISCEVHQSLMDTGLGKFGCSHYRRKCKIRAPCCDEIFDCRHCHNKAKNSDSFWKLSIARDQTAQPKIEAILGDPQSEDQWGAFGLLDIELNLKDRGLNTLPLALPLRLVVDVVLLGWLSGITIEGLLGPAAPSIVLLWSFLISLPDPIVPRLSREPVERSR
ncbi:hypothetical protein LguiA_017466 [Lonicera macranthoides]